jgi:hypothetical protein
VLDACSSSSLDGLSEKTASLLSRLHL